MLLDWFTVAAQIVNFLILVALLKRFLYGRIVKAMDEREARIAARLQMAAEERQKAEREAELYREKNEQFNAEREEMLASSRKEAEARRKELLHKTREEVDGVRARWMEALRMERQLFLMDLRGMISRKVCSTARRVLGDLANVKLEQQIIEVFTEKIRQLEPDTSKNVDQPLHTTERGLTVRSTFEIPPELQGEIAETARGRFGNVSTWDRLFSALIQEYIFVSLSRAAAESLTSENVSRLASMQVAEKNIDERLTELTNRYYQQRQATITEELLDIISGFEALGC